MNDQGVPQYRMPGEKPRRQRRSRPSGEADVDEAKIGQDDNRARKQQQLLRAFEKYDLSDKYFGEIEQLIEYDIVLICDDSGSMHGSRWKELKEVVTAVVNIGVATDQDGIELAFLNRQPDDGSHLYRLNTATAAAKLFESNPYGRTPLVGALRKHIQSANKKRGKTLIIVATDGEPTDTDGKSAFAALSIELHQKVHDKVKVAFIKCTEEPLEYLDKIDREVDSVDVNDDYETEKQEVLKRDPTARFSYGDWLMKIMLGAIDPKYDRSDEHPPKTEGGCCVIC
eukprot:TRINITY_DN64853_c0_g1_i5.p1 TRINITY_DN64853_c0_g1~~TRINITY_DN64853_c0_g1_i5.p1  ORF type:complete len:296 (+),score=126.57 TRINITY_DN64853_c0_g1_i5:38-889(+)